MKRIDGLRIGAIYIRVSTDKQEELSPDAQLREGLAWAKQNNIVVPPEFIFMEERGISGKSADKRPEFKRMIGMAKSLPRPFDVIIVWKFSRFARNQDESTFYKSLLRKKCGIDVVSVTEPLMDGMFGRLIEMQIEWWDEFYSIRLSEDVLRGMTERALRGGYQAIPCLGYQAVGKGAAHIINEEEFSIVEQMAQLYDEEHLDFTTIAREINARGYLTRRGNPFEARGIYRILTNRFYIGIVEWNGMEYEGTHEIRFTQEQFDRRMERINREKRKHKERNMSGCKHWLSGIVRCPICGKNLSYCSEARYPSGKKRTAYFQCYEYSKGKHPESVSISEQKLIRGVYTYFEKLLAGDDFEYFYRPPAATQNTNELERLQNELKRLEIKEERVKIAYENEIDTLEEYKANKLRLLDERENILAGIRELTAPELQKPPKEAVLSKIRTVYDVIKNPDIDYTTKGTFIRSVVDEIVYDKENSRLHFRIYVS